MKKLIKKITRYLFLLTNRDAFTVHSIGQVIDDADRLYSSFDPVERVKRGLAQRLVEAMLNTGAIECNSRRLEGVAGELFEMKVYVIKK